MIEAKVTAGENKLWAYNKYYNRRAKPKVDKVKSKRIISTGVDVGILKREADCNKCQDRGTVLIPIKVKRNNATRYVQEACECISVRD